MHIVVCQSSKKIAIELQKHLSCKLINAQTKTFSCGEMLINIDFKLPSDINEIYVFQTLAPDVNNTIIELLLVIDSIKRNINPNKIIAIIPYLCYSRQDRKLLFNAAIGSKVIANLIAKNINKIITFDLHSLTGMGFYNIPIINISPSHIIESHIKTNSNIDNIAIISPDLGGTSRAKLIGDLIKKDIIITYKRHLKDKIYIDILENKNCIYNKDCIIIDDIIESGQTISKVTNELLNKGAKSVVAYCTHNLINNFSIKFINEIPITKIYSTNTIYNSYIPKKMEILDIYHILAKNLM